MTPFLSPKFELFCAEMAPNADSRLSSRCLQVGR
jgi:hypothetical protein